jgi:hypothetical protein
MPDRARIADTLRQFFTENAPPIPIPGRQSDVMGIRGRISYVLLDGAGRVLLEASVPNLVTQVGDQYYGERAAAISGAPAVATGMQLGSGTTAPAKTGAGASIVTLVAASLVAFSVTPASSLSGSSRRITYQAFWAAGVATSTSPVIAEVALVNQATATQTVAPAANTIARGLLSPTVPKAAGDTLAVTWTHDLLGA